MTAPSLDRDQMAPAPDQRSIVTDPCRRGGAPCIAGTRLDTDLVAGYHWSDGLEGVLQAYPHLTRDGVLVACWWSVRYGKKRWRRRWWDWFRAVPSGTGGWWDEDWSAIPLPPTESEAPVR